MPYEIRARDAMPRIAVLAAAFVATTATSCRLTTSPPPDEPRLGSQSTAALSPEELRREAHRVDRGIIAGSGERGESALIPLVAPPGRALALPAPWRTSGVEPLRIAATPPRPGMRILTLSGDGASGDGRAAAWAAVAAASRAVGAELGKLGFELELPEAAPAHAEAALAAGFIAAATGLEFQPDVAALGALAIDGTLLPSAGIREAAAAARDLEVQTLGLPPGAPNAEGAETIDDVVAAARLLTGRRLPEPTPVSREQMALSDSEAKAAHQAYAEVRRRLATRWSRIAVLENQAPLPAPLADLVRRSQRDARLAEEAASRGEHAAAYAFGRSAAIAAEAAADTWEVVEAMRERELDRARAVFHGRAPAHDIAVGASESPSVAAAMRRLEALGAAARAEAMARGSAAAADSALAYAEEAAELPDADRRARPVTAGAVRAALPAAMAAARAADQRAVAEALVTFDDPPSPPLRATPERLHRLAVSLTAIGAAKVDASSSKTGSPAYVYARHARDTALASAEPLAAAFVAYTDGWQAAVESHSLGIARRATSGEIESVESPAFIDGLLERAEVKARRHARAVQTAAGFIPVTARLHYAAARAVAAGDDRDRARALFAYWRASAACQLALSLALR